MKILTPIMSPNDIDVLNPNVYNTEFFFGYIPEWWINKYSKSYAFTENNVLSTPINNRNDIKANTTSINDVKKIITKAKRYNTNAFLVLNAKYYPEYIYEDLIKYLDEISSAGVTNIIASDIGLISLIENNYPNIKVAVSCLNQITNSKAVEFYLKFKNVNRIVFPRHMTVLEIKEIASKFPNTEFEFFIFSNKCLYDDGYCRSIHAFTPFCKDLFYNDFFYNESVIEGKKQIQYQNHANDFFNWTRNLISSCDTQYCTNSFACSACSLKELIVIPNIVSVKLSIRGHLVDERKKQTIMANEAIKFAQNGDLIGLQNAICRCFGKEDLCSSGDHCMMK